MLSAFLQYQISLWIVAFLFLLVLLIPMELGFRLGVRRRRLHPKPDREVRSDVTLTAMLALLGLVLAFTYSFSMSRADLRKKALIAEVNALGTAFLRADLLDEPGRTDVRQRLYEYTKSRDVQPGAITTLEEVQAVVERSKEIQSRIWPAVKAALRQQGDTDQQGDAGQGGGMTDPEKALLIASINDVLDSHTSRMAVFYDRLPTAVLLLLLLIAGISMGVAAYNSSLNGHQPRLRTTAFAFILASTMYIILDYDMMMRGFIQIDQSPLVELIDEMETGLNR